MCIRYSTLKPSMRRPAATSIAFYVIASAYIVALIVQDGMFEAACVCVGIFLPFGGIAFVEFSILIFEPLASFARGRDGVDKIQKRLYFFFLLSF
jgi:hypothetical protein